MCSNETLARGPGGLAEGRYLDELRGEYDGLNKQMILAEWHKILEVNYWPIFDVACRLLEVIPTLNIEPLLDGLAATASKLLKSGLMRSHDLTGAVFQRLIADRKFLAAYYTTPSSAALMAGLALQRFGPPNNVTLPIPVHKGYGECARRLAEYFYPMTTIERIGDVAMEFYLTYAGQLYATQRSARPHQPSPHRENKKRIRSVFHEQLKTLWTVAPSLRGN